MDQLVERVNCFGLGDWLEGMLNGIGAYLPTCPASSAAMLQRGGGLTIRLEVLDLAPAPFDPRDAFYIALAECDTTVHPPLGLDRTAETIETASAKLSSSMAGGNASDIAAGDRRVSFFFAGGRMIEIDFKPGLVGFDRLTVARLGEPQDWRGPSFP